MMTHHLPNALLISSILAMVTTLAVFSGVVRPSAAAEADELAKLETAFATNIELLATPLEDLNTSYENALGRLAKEVGAKGNLDALLAIKDERANYRDGPTGKLANSAELGKMRGLYEQNRARRLGALNAKLREHTAAYLTRVETLVVSLTKEGKVDLAVAASEEAGRIRKLLDDDNPAKLASSLIGVTMPDTSGQAKNGDGANTELNRTGFKKWLLTKQISFIGINTVALRFEKDHVLWIAGGGTKKYDYKVGSRRGLTINGNQQFEVEFSDDLKTGKFRSSRGEYDVVIEDR